MRNNYDAFFKSAQAKKLPSSNAKKMDIKKLKTESQKQEEELKKTIQGIHSKHVTKKHSRMRKRFPLSSALGVALTLVGFTVIGYNVEKFEEVLSTIEVNVLGAATAATEGPSTSEANNSQTKEKKEATNAADASQEKSANSENVSSMGPEELALFKSLDERRRVLDQREAELKKLDEELQKQKAELDQRFNQLEQVRKSIANQLEEKVKVDQERVDQLVAFYSTMKAQQAAKIIESLNEDLAIEVLLKMKKKSAAEVMNLMASDKAQRLSEKFAGYRRK